MLFSRIRYSFLSLFIVCILQGETLQDEVLVEKDRILIKQFGPPGKDPFIQTVDISPFRNLPQEDSNCSICVKWSEKSYFNTWTDDPHCKYYEYRAETNGPLNVTFNISGVYVYGGPEQNYQTYPMNLTNYVNYPFVSQEANSQAVLEPYWLLSSGTYIYVDQTVPLFVTFDKTKGTFQIIAKGEAPYASNNTPHLKYRVCMLENMLLAQKHAINKVLTKPDNEPDGRMVEFPIWSTWAKYKSKITQAVVLDFAQKITDYKFPNSQLEIDDRWEKCYGSFAVDEEKFPNMTNLVRQLKDMHFRVTLWVHPFINEDCEPSYTYAKQQGYFVKGPNNSVTTRWWNGENAGHIDFTNKKAVNWWKERLQDLKKKLDVDSFKFDAGESSWCPQLPVFNSSSAVYPETNLQAYVQVASTFGKMVEVRVGRGTGKHQVYVRMLDFESEWSGKRGLVSMIPTLLQMNTIGYSFILPDYVGGNGYNGNVPDAELLIRWLQVNTFMPVVQLSYPPWDFNKTIIDIAKKYIKLHNHYAKKIESEMKEYTRSGVPVHRPLWWADPEDPQTYTIDSEFLLGDDILVAPVLEKGAVSRNIYLPKGTWQDEVNKSTKPIKGPVWLYNYSAGLDVLPYFSKINGGKTSAATSALISFSTFFFVTFAVPLFFIILDVTVTL